MALCEVDLSLILGDSLHGQLDNLIAILKCVHKHGRSDAHLQARGEFVEELLQLGLAHLGVTSTLEEFTDLILEALVEAHIRHGHVCIVNLLLLGLRFGADLGDQDGQLTEDVSLENGTGQVNHYHENQFFELLRAHFIATDDQHGVVEADPVQEHSIVVFVPIPERIIAIVIVVRWDPGLVTAVLQ